MRFNPDVHRRKSIRLKEYDYSENGYFFITICAQNSQCFFGSISDGNITLNQAGEIICKVWKDLKERFDNIILDEYIIMPNHLHAILALKNVGAIPCGCPGVVNKKRLGDIIGAFKSMTTNEYIKNVNDNNWTPFEKKLWQRNYHERIIRNDGELTNIRKYIIENPYRWDDDEENPDKI